MALANELEPMRETQAFCAFFMTVPPKVVASPGRTAYWYGP